MSVYENKNAQEKITFHFTDLWGCQWYVLQERHECSEYFTT